MICLKEASFLLIGCLYHEQKVWTEWVGLLCSESELCAWDNHIKYICCNWHHTEPRVKKNSTINCCKPSLFWRPTFQRKWNVKCLAIIKKKNPKNPPTNFPQITLQCANETLCYYIHHLVNYKVLSKTHSQYLWWKTSNLSKNIVKHFD